jgi:hypothetical protein
VTDECLRRHGLRRLALQGRNDQRCGCGNDEPLGELELHNTFQLSIFRSEIDISAAILKKQLFAEDLAKGVFAIHPVPATTLYPKAMERAQRHSAKLGICSMDLMHVAAALILEADLFLSFDERQHKAAEAEGLKLDF